jgi:hypothetical protein
MAKPVASAEEKLTQIATFSGDDAKRAKKCAMNKNKGAPGGCTTCIFIEPGINSPQSQKLTEASIVIA